MEPVAPSSALGTALIKCFNTDGDCTIAVPRIPSTQRCSAAEDRAQRSDMITFRVWSRLLAAWSEVFAAMFAHNMKEQKDGVIEILDFSPDAVEIFLRYLYSGNISMSPDALVEVAALADKYAVSQLQEACARRFEQELSPTSACEMLEIAYQLRSHTVQERCREVIYSTPKQALLGGFVLNDTLLDDVLSSKMLCITDYELAMILLEWGKNPTIQSKCIDLCSLIDRHVQVAAFTQEEYSKVLSFAGQVGCADKIKDMWQRCKRGTHTDDLFASLYRMFKQYANEGSRRQPPFLGYWVNLIPSCASFGEASVSFNGKEDSTYNKFGPLATLEMIARNESSMVLGTNEEMVWMIPHHGIYVSGISFYYQLQEEGHVHLLASVDGQGWEMIFDSSTVSLSSTTAKMCFRSSTCVCWFKLCVRKGKYSNRLRIHGILQPK